MEHTSASGVSVGTRKRKACLLNGGPTPNELNAVNDNNDARLEEEEHKVEVKKETDQEETESELVHQPHTTQSLPIVSIIIPVHNEEAHIAECFESILAQTYRGPMEVSIFDDWSEDSSPAIIKEWMETFKSKNIESVVRTNGPDFTPKGRGCGFAKNRSVDQSKGEYLCFLDADDIMMPERIELQLQAALEQPDTIIGSNFVRIPEGSTERYTSWCNRLTQEELMTHRFREVTIIQPTWFMSRDTFNKVGGYDESFPKCPEDLIFFHAHLEKGGKLFKVDKPLLKYRYKEDSTCQGIHRLVLSKLRAEAFQRQILSRPEWSSFTIWGFGRDGRKFYNSLSTENKLKVAAFCDINPKRVGTDYHNTRGPKETWRKIPVIHFSQAKPPIVTCVALDRTDNAFENNVASLHLREGVDLFYFN